MTHLGSSPNCGHYTAIAEASNGNFYQFDDNYVNQVTQSTALNNDAYVIIYEMDKRCKKSPESPPSQSCATSTPTSSYTSNLSFSSSTVTSSSSSSSNINILIPKKAPSAPIPKIGSLSSSTTPSKLVQKSDDELKGSPSRSDTADGINGSSSTANGSIKPIGLERKMISFGIRPSISPRKITLHKPGVSLTNSSKLGQSSSHSLASSVSAASRAENKSDQIKIVPYDDDEESDKDDVRNGAGASPNNTKRLKSPENTRKQSPGRNNVQTPITPAKSPKPSSLGAATANSPPSSISASNYNRISSTGLHGNEENAGSSTTKPSSENSNSSSGHRDGVKRKASADEETNARKSRSHRKRHSSSSSASSASSESSSTSANKQSSKCKRKRNEEVSQSPVKSSDRERKAQFSQSSSQNEPASSGSSRKDRGRDNHSEERDRERRRDRNPSRSRSPSADSNIKAGRGSSCDRKRENTSNGAPFDPSRLRQEKFSKKNRKML